VSAIDNSRRLPEGGRIDRTRPLTFTFDGKSYTGFQGDTLASALLANGVTLFGRSFKYHRPRGVIAAGSEEPNALVQLEEGAYTEPNTRATCIELYDGLVAASQNRWPSLKFDVGAVNSLFARFLPAGFYYKTFMWPASMWMTYEKFIRRAAGLGISPTENDPDVYHSTHAHCDVLIIGAGPAGLAAALSASSSGARVLVVDEGSTPGGALLGVANNTEVTRYVEDAVQKLIAAEDVTLLTRTTAVGYFDYNYVTAVEKVTDHVGPRNGGDSPRQRFYKIRAKQVVLTTGAIERPLVFADNDRPGVMLANAVSTYVNRYGVLPGKNIVVFTNNDSAYQVAIETARAGAKVIIVDTRTDIDATLESKIQEQRIQVFKGHAITAVKGTKKITAVRVMPLTTDNTAVEGQAYEIVCDVVANSGGWTPSVHMFSQSGGKLKYLDSIEAFVADESRAKHTSPNFSAGSCAGDFDTESCVQNGLLAGAKASAACGFSLAAQEATEVALVAEQEIVQGNIAPIWLIPTTHKVGEGGAKHFHDFQNDATAADIFLAEREGFVSVEHLKRYTTTGMATDQGKTSNLNAMSIMASIRGVSIPEVGTTTFRPPYTPLTFGVVGGQESRDLFIQERHTPMHEWHVAAGAEFEDVGDWKRSWYYPNPGEDMHAAVQRETLAVRQSVGMLDASTLGKIDIQGKDAVKLLEMVYTNNWQKLAVGSCRCTSVTEQWAVVALNGPQARALLQSITDIDLANESFPFMTLREGQVAGVPARVYRISFTGELSYEMLWQALDRSVI